MKILKSLFTYLILPLAIVGIVALIVSSVRKPVEFNKQKDARQAVAVQRLKDIRTLQVAYKSVNGKYTASFDTLENFYNTGKMFVIMQIGSSDDSLAVANTEKIKKAKKGITPLELKKLYEQGEKLVFSIKEEIPVADTLFNNRSDFSLKDLRYIPFTDGELIEMDAIVKKVSGVDVSLFEAKIPYKKLLVGLDNQLRVNLDAEREAAGHYVGLQVGSVTDPNNNAGNWE